MIISKEESQDQVQVYIEEIIQENPAPSLETGLRTSCEVLSPKITGCYNSNNIKVDYCSHQCGDLDGIGGDDCVVRCDLFKRGRCDDTNYCTWTVDNICKCEAPTCSDNDGDGYTGTPAGCGPDCDDSNSNVLGNGGCKDADCVINVVDGTDNCASGLECGRNNKCVFIIL